MEGLLARKLYILSLRLKKIFDIAYDHYQNNPKDETMKQIVLLTGQLTCNEKECKRAAISFDNNVPICKIHRK